MKRDYSRKIIIGTLFIVLLIACAYYLNTTTKRSMVNSDYSRSDDYVYGVVTRIIEENIEPSQEFEGISIGSQTLKVKLTTAPYKDEFHVIHNTISLNYNNLCKVGDKIVLVVSHTIDETYTVYMYNQQRAPYVYGLLGVFVIFMLILGGKKGLRSILGLSFTLFSIYFIFIPLIYRGYHPIACSIGLTVITSFVTLYLINGHSKKTCIAILGTLSGTLTAGLFAYFSEVFAKLNGFQMEDAEALIVLSRDYGMHISGLLFASILIASLGAVMDIAMSISASLNEIKQQNPSIEKKALFLSGIEVGKDMIGTMSNTLILAFTGASLSLLLILFSYDTSLIQFMNMDSIVIEILQGLSGSLGLLLTVPITAYLFAYLPIRTNN